MEIISYSSKYLEDLINLWNDSVASVSILSLLLSIVLRAKF